MFEVSVCLFFNLGGRSASISRFLTTAVKFSCFSFNELRLPWFFYVTLWLFLCHPRQCSNTKGDIWHRLTCSGWTKVRTVTWLPSIFSYPWCSTARAPLIITAGETNGRSKCCCSNAVVYSIFAWKRSKRAWSDCVLCMTFILRGIPKECGFILVAHV